MLPWESLLYYTHYDRRWYETSSRYAPSDEHLAVYRSIAPDGWRTRRRGLWFIADPPGVTMASQGWKLHVTALTDESAEILRLALPVLCETRTPFKFLIDPYAVGLTSGKVFSRTASGKFITVYPADDEQFRTVGAKLAAALDGRTGPYILSDRRWPGSTSVYYRYGGFKASARLRPDGINDLLIATPDGVMVPDVRRPYFEVPEWAADPFPGAEEEPDEALGGRYLPHTALAFGNRGGVYLATDTQTGQNVVLKEARPGVTVGNPARSVIEVLEKEHRLLAELADTGLFVRPLGFFREWDHAFLVQEKLDGTHFSHHCIVSNPTITLDLRPESLRAYYESLRGLWRQIAEAITVAHERGILLGDLSYTNVFVEADGRTVKILDLETAVQREDPHLGVHTMGLASPRLMATSRYDRAADWHALGALILSSIMVVNNTTGFHRPALPRFLAELAADLALPRELVDLISDLTDDDAADDTFDGATVVKRIDALPFGEPTQWAEPVPLALPAAAGFGGEPGRMPAPSDQELANVADGVAAYAEAVADPQRTDRLFPADPMVFETNPMSVAYGAAGVLHGLVRLRGAIPPKLLGWAASRDIDSADYPPGVYLGQAGIAWVLDEVGRPEAAAALMDRARSHPLRFVGAGVMHGSAGYGMACLHLWRRLGDERLLDDARSAGEALAASCVRDELGARWPETVPHGDGKPFTKVGYGHGASGVALFLLYLHLATGEERWYDLGRAALGFDLGQRTRVGDHLWLFHRYARDLREDQESEAEDPVLRNYWEEGTAGVTTAALRYLAARPDPELAALVPELLNDSCRKYSVFPQLFRGLAGLGNVLLDAGELLGEERWFAEARRTAQGILLSRIDREDGVVFPGSQALRESVDFATGSTGVALFLDRVRRARPGGRTNFNFVVDGLLP